MGVKSLSEVQGVVQFLQKAKTERMKITLECHKSESERMMIGLELKQEIADLQTKGFELIQRNKFVTELIDDNRSQINSKQYESLKSPLKI